VTPSVLFLAQNRVYFFFFFLDVIVGTGLWREGWVFLIRPCLFTIVGQPGKGNYYALRDSRGFALANIGKT
jgi:hypothetical protein